MPELPEIETVTRALSKIIKRSKVKSIEIYRTDLRWQVPNNLKETIENDIFEEPFRRGKYILIPTKKGNILLIHLGMSGQIKIKDTIPSLLKHDHIRIIIENKNNQIFSITYNDPRRFGYVDYLSKIDMKTHFLLKNLGVEPFSKYLTNNYLYNIYKKKTTNIKNALLDQKIIAGIGNIYASEILFRAKIKPDRNVNSLTSKDLELIINSTKEILKNSIKKGGTTIKDHKQPDGKLGYFKQDLAVYGKVNEKCNVCKKLIEVSIISNRSTFFCNYCQK
jgi:formamidopyrimidine-DNA glycosylase